VPPAVALRADARPRRPDTGAPTRTPTPTPGVGDPDTRRRAVLCCRACGAVVTTPDRAIVVREAHAHHVFNPAGVLFYIGCFADAPGVRAVGPRSDQFSWFPGHSWIVTVCAGCGRHLGWLFLSGAGGGGFHALILDRLAETDTDGEGDGDGGL
jgi:hypothetical protein